MQIGCSSNLTKTTNLLVGMEIRGIRWVGVASVPVIDSVCLSNTRLICKLGVVSDPPLLHDSPSSGGP